MGLVIDGMDFTGIGAAASTLAFNTLTLNELAHAYSSRSEYRHVFSRDDQLPPNQHLNKAIAGMAGLQALVSIGVNLGVLPTKGLTLPLISSVGRRGCRA